MKTLFDLRLEQNRLEQEWLAEIYRLFPSRNQFDWFRALAAARDPNVRKNEDQSDDAALVAAASIREKYDAFIKALHTYYKARDGEKGFLRRAR